MMLSAPFILFAHEESCGFDEDAAVDAVVADDDDDVN